MTLDDYKFGAAVASALVNTGPEVQSRGDGIPDAEALSGFLAAHRVRLSGRAPEAADVAAVHALRGVLRELITTADAAELVDRAGELASSVGVGPELRADGDGRWQWHARTRPGAALVDELTLLTATGVLAVLRTLGPDRLRSCASPTCNGVFIDTSRTGRRRYCEPERCGNRINVAAYRARRRAER